MTITSSASTETRAIRMLAAGDSHKDIAQTTGLPLDDIRRLDAERPKPRPAAPPAGAPVRQGPPTRLPVRLLLEHPDNVRSDLGDLTEMTASIVAQGILQPLLVTPDTDGRWLVIAGHRRLAAAKQAKLVDVPVHVRGRLNGSDAVAAMLVENLQRADLHPLDEAAGYQQLVDDGLSQAEIARVVGISQVRVSRRIKLNYLTDAEKHAMRIGDLGESDAYHAARSRGGRQLRGDTARPKPRKVPHFTIQHPPAEDAGARCEHATSLKLGIACGPCWEAAIRADERRTLARNQWRRMTESTGRYYTGRHYQQWAVYDLAADYRNNRAAGPYPTRDQADHVAHQLNHPPQPERQLALGEDVA